MGKLATIGELRTLGLTVPQRPHDTALGLARQRFVDSLPQKAGELRGALTLAGGGVVGEHRVDLLSPAGLATWGDVRLTIVGTEGTLEVRANIDVGGEPGGEHLIVTDGEGVRRVDVSGDSLGWAEDLLADLADGGERLCSQDHVLTVSELTLQAQERARPWGRP